MTDFIVRPGVNRILLLNTPLQKSNDEYIQQILNKYKYYDEKKEFKENTGKDVDLVISHKPTIPDLVIYNENAEAGIITFNIKGVFAQDLATYLNSRGIACRSGQHCAKLLHHFTNELATVRMSMYFYTTKEDVDALVEALKNGGNFLDAYFA